MLESEDELEEESEGEEFVFEQDLSFLSDVERALKKRFEKEGPGNYRLPSTAADARSSARVETLTLPDDMRAKMPMTKDKYLVRENPHLVSWERECRKFLRNLSPDHGHRVSAVMIYEWATGIRIADIQALSPERLQPGKQNWRSDLRKINRTLEWYFGRPYMTWIAGRKVMKAYRVKPGYYIRYHRPMTITLYAEHVEGVLYP